MEEDLFLMSLIGSQRDRRGRATKAQAVMRASTYGQLEQHVADFLASNEHKLLRTAGEEVSDWFGIGVPSAVRHTLKAIDPVTRASLGKVIWVKLPYERARGWTLRAAQRRVAEEVLGVAAAKELMDGADEDDEYSGVEVNSREVVGDVSRRIADELTRRGRFLLVIENWWEQYSPDLEGLGIPPPSRWSPQGAKVILWDPMFTEEMTPLGEPATNGWLLLQQPAAGDILSYVYREAIDVADVLNSKSSITVITPQAILDSLLFTSLLFADKNMELTHPFHRSKPEILQFWVQNGLITAHNVNASGRRAAASHDDNMINTTTAEALLEELLHRRLLIILYSPNLVRVTLLGMLLEWTWELATFDGAQGLQDFQPCKCVIQRDSHILGTLTKPENLQGVSIVHAKHAKQPLLLPIDDGGGPWYAKLCNLRTLILERLQCFPADDFFSKMVSLRVLIISKAKVQSLPSSLFGLPNLRILLLLHCKYLNRFFVPGAPTTALHGLRVLELTVSTITHFPDEAFSHMHSLEELLLRSCSQLSINEHLSFLANLPMLRVLDLSSCGLMEALPNSILMAAPNLKKLVLSECSQLKTLQPNLYCHSALEELDCRALQEVDIEFKMPMLKLIRLSGSSAVRRLSFKGCNKLEVIELSELQNLESLNLSATAIKDLRQCTLPSKSLIFLGANSLRTFPWKMMKQLPKQLILDQHVGEASSCNKEFDLTQQQSHDGGGVWMRVCDGRFFRMLCDPKTGTYSQLASSFVQHFHISIIAPSAKRSKEAGITCEFGRRVPSQYGCIQVHSKILQKQSSLRRHVDIQGSHPSPSDIHALLKNTLSLSLSNQHSYKSLSELMPMDSVVKQCQIEECHGMEAIFVCSADGCPLQSLETVWASELRTVAALAVEKGSNFDWPQGFKHLKHVHLEFCPKLRYVFPPGARHGLQSLEVLEILFCPNLKEVFAAPSQESQQAALSSSSATLPFAPCLRIVHLLQLPCLLSVCHEADTHWPALERFKVRGCWRLRKLPFLSYSSLLPATRTVTIDGEPVWWKKVVEGGGITAKCVFHSAGTDLPLPMPK